MTEVAAMSLVIDYKQCSVKHKFSITKKKRYTRFLKECKMHHSVTAKT
jgi:hypothetical protein